MARSQRRSRSRAQTGGRWRRINLRATTKAPAAARKALLCMDARGNMPALQWADKAQAACAAPSVLAPVLAPLRPRRTRCRRRRAGRHARGAFRRTRLGARAAGRTGECAALLGPARMQPGDRRDAAAALQRALDIDRALGLPDRIALDLLHAGDNAAAAGQRDAARDFYERPLRVAMAAELKRTIAAAQQRMQVLPGR
jgi:tetratricopeptide (TPR) repeat protein